MNTPCIFPHGLFDNPQVEHGAKETMTGKAKCKRNKNTGSGNNDKRLNYWEKDGAMIHANEHYAYTQEQGSPVYKVRVVK